MLRQSLRRSNSSLKKQQNSRRRYRWLTLEERICYEMRSILVLLSFLGYKLQDEETFEEFSLRVKTGNQMETFECQSVEAFQEWRYGGCTATAELEQLIQIEKKQVIAILRTGKRRTYVYVRIYMVLYTDKNIKKRLE